LSFCFYEPLALFARRYALYRFLIASFWHPLLYVLCGSRRKILALLDDRRFLLFRGIVNPPAMLATPPHFRLVINIV
jgi:hypothetical protein